MCILGLKLNLGTQFEYNSNSYHMLISRKKLTMGIHIQILAIKIQSIQH